MAAMCRAMSRTTMDSMCPTGRNSSNALLQVILERRAFQDGRECSRRRRGVGCNGRERSTGHPSGAAADVARAGWRDSPGCCAFGSMCLPWRGFGARSVTFGATGYTKMRSASSIHIIAGQSERGHGRKVTWPRHSRHPQPKPLAARLDQIPNGLGKAARTRSGRGPIIVACFVRLGDLGTGNPRTLSRDDSIDEIRPCGGDWIGFSIEPNDGLLAGPLRSWAATPGRRCRH